MDIGARVDQETHRSVVYQPIDANGTEGFKVRIFIGLFLIINHRGRAFNRFNSIGWHFRDFGMEGFTIGFRCRVTVFSHGLVNGNLEFLFTIVHLETESATRRLLTSRLGGISNGTGFGTSSLEILVVTGTEGVMVLGRMGLATDITRLIVPPFLVGGKTMSASKEGRTENTALIVSTGQLIQSFKSKVLVTKGRTEFRKLS
jgi:hypothetical protein